MSGMSKPTDNNSRQGADTSLRFMNPDLINSKEKNLSFAPMII